MANGGFDFNSSGSLAAASGMCASCYMIGCHSPSCPYGGSYSFRINSIKEDGMANSNGSVIEVVLITEDEDGECQVAFGPKAYATPNANAAVAKATGEFIEGGGDASEVVNALTRFFG